MRLRVLEASYPELVSGSTVKIKEGIKYEYS